MQMPYVTIVGATGYAGQETLDRVLHTPSWSSMRSGRTRWPDGTRRAQSPAEPGTAAAGARLITERGGPRERCGRHLHLPPARGGSGAVAALARHRGRPLGRPPPDGCRPVRRVVRLHASPAVRARPLVVRPARGSARSRTPRREPRLLRDRRAARARAARRRRRARERRRRRDVRDDRRRPVAEGVEPRGLGAGERLRYRIGRTSTCRDRPAPQLPVSSAAPAAPSGAACSRPATSARPAPTCAASSRSNAEERS